MRPVRFREANRVLARPPGAAGQWQGPLHVLHDGARCVSCWRASPVERLSILLSGRVWVSVPGGIALPPLGLEGRKRPFARKGGRCLLAGAARACRAILARLNRRRKEAAR